MKNATHLALFVALLVIFSVLPLLAKRSIILRQQQLNSLLGWLPRASEMVFVSTGPLGDAPSLLEMCRRWSCSPQLDLAARRSVLAVTKLKEKDEFEGCRLVLLASRDQASKDAITRDCREEPGYRVPVWRSVGKQGTVFFSFPLPDLLLEAHDENSLREVLERVQAEESVQLPPALEKFRDRIDEEAPFWVIRAEKGKPGALCMDWLKKGAVRIQLVGFARPPRAYGEDIGLTFAAEGEVFSTELSAEGSQLKLTNDRLVFAWLLGFRSYL